MKRVRKASAVENGATAGHSRSAAIRQNRISARFLVEWSLLAATAIAFTSSTAAEVSLAKVDAKFIKSFMPQSDLEVKEESSPQSPWDNPQCRERRDFVVWRKDGRHSNYSVWLCHGGVLGIDGLDSTVEESLKRLGHGDPNQSDSYKAGEGWTFHIDGRQGRVIVVTVGSADASGTAMLLPTAAIRSLDDGLNLAVATDDLQLMTDGLAPITEALEKVEEILRAVERIYASPTP